MKKLIIAFSFLSLSIAAQTSTIKGSLTNLEIAKKPIAVALLEAKSKNIVKITTVAKDGIFEFKSIAFGAYLLSLSADGIQEYESPTFIVDQPLQTIDPIELNSKIKQLEDVKIVAKKPLVEVFADKTVFNVQNSIGAAGLSAFEVLRKAPGVVIDNSENLIVEGKTGVQIYVDGKPSVLAGQDLVNYLKSISSNDVDIVEIITQPSSKYEAAGTAGIVNIKLKKDKKLGANGSVATGYTIGRYARYNNSLSVNNRTKMFNFFGSYSNRFENNYNFINLNRTQSNTVFDSKTETVSNNNINNLKVGVDFFKNAKNTFGFVFNGNFNNNFADGDTRTPITIVGANSPLQVLIASTHVKTRSYNLQQNFNYRYVGANGKSLSTDLDFGQFDNNRTNYQPNSYFNGNQTILLQEFKYRMNTPININIISLKTDYEQDLLKGKISLGFKTSLVKTDNTFNFYNIINNTDALDVNRSNQFKFSENINAGYFNFNKKYAKINFQAGIRVEQTISEGNLISTQVNKNNTVNRKYVDYFPSCGITYNQNQNNAWQLNYGRRIERPSYQTLNPFEMQIDELSFQRGNPFLQPQYIDNYKIGHTYKYKLNTTLSYSFINDFFAQITQAEGANKNYIQTKNVATQEVWNLGISYPFAASKWWDVYFSVNASNSSFKGRDNSFISITQNTFNFYGQNTFSLPKKIKMEVSGWFSSPSVWGGTYRTKSLGALDIAVQKKIFKEKFNLKLTVSDVLFTAPWNGEFSNSDLIIVGNGGQDSRQFRVNLSYNFGNSNLKNTQRNSSIEEENKRI